MFSKDLPSLVSLSPPENKRMKVIKNSVIVIFLLYGIPGCQNTTDKNKTVVKKLTDEQLMDTVQKQTFRYFWDFAEPNSGLSKERNTEEWVTSGGSGFGIMAIVVGVERGYITRDAAVERMLKIVNFLEKAERFHGAWSHWLYGKTGKAKPFSKYDDGGDLVETAYLVQGLLTAKEYFNKDNKELGGNVYSGSAKFCRFAGYYSYDLKTPLELKKDEKFYIVVTYINSMDKPLPIEQYIKDYSSPHITSGKCWINPNPEKWPISWYEVGINSNYDFLSFDLCIRAYFLNN